MQKTIPELSDELRQVRRQIRKARSQVSEAKLSAKSLRSPHLSAAPASSQPGSVTERSYERIEKLENRIGELTYRELDLEYELYLQIEDEPDARLRLALRARYIDFRSWPETAAAVGGGNTPDAIRQEIKRYFRHAETAD